MLTDGAALEIPPVSPSVCLLEFPLAWDTNTQRLKKNHHWKVRTIKVDYAMGDFFFHTDKDQFECLRLSVIRYKTVVGGRVCQKSIAEAIHFTLPTGS